MNKPFNTLIILLIAFQAAAQQVPHTPYGQIVLVNRLYETNTKMIRPDKPVSVRMIDGRKLEGAFYLEDERTMVIGPEKIRMDSIIALTGYIIRNSTEKAAGITLSFLSVLGTIYPLYEIIGGFGLGDGKAIFVGATILFFDLILAYAGTNLAGIIPRRFSMVNWMIRVDYKSNADSTIPVEIFHITDPRYR
ncbi:MAG: hypothetical protein AMS27_14495 [Bacteroides sp. SM23_62_1]|nr:MAG: hypothetical protein AMS27_14495 [Bacteroides sp. SM23_62_1]